MPVWAIFAIRAQAAGELGLAALVCKKPTHKASADLTLREAAKALGLSVSTVRTYVKAGKLQASTVAGKYGPEYRFRPAVVAAYAREYLGLELDADALAKAAKGQAGSP